MADIVKRIRDEAEDIAEATLGSGYQKLRHVFNVEKNDLRNTRLGFRVRPLGAIPATTVTKTYTLDHDFELVLTDYAARTDNDLQRIESLDVMYDKADEIFKDYINSKINLADIVLLVDSPTLLEPEFVNDNKVIVLRMQFTVKWRSDTTA